MKLSRDESWLLASLVIKHIEESRVYFRRLTDSTDIAWERERLLTCEGLRDRLFANKAKKAKEALRRRER